jgi:hypothetical protein
VHCQSENMNRGRLRLLALKIATMSCVLSAVAPTGVVAQTATIHVRVLDGRTGKNLSGMKPSFVDYHTNSDGSTNADLHGRMRIETSTEGDLYIANPDPHGVLVFAGLGTELWTPCTGHKLYDSHKRAYGSDHLYSVPTIIASGLTANNNCSRRTATAKPGELTVFLRPATWWEKLIWGMQS